MDKKVIVTKVVCKDPLAIGGRPGGTVRDIIPDDFPKVAESYVDSKEIKVWESKIKYYQTRITSYNVCYTKLLRCINNWALYKNA